MSDDKPIYLAGPKMIKRALEVIHEERARMKEIGWKCYKSADEYDLNMAARLYALETLKEEPHKQRHVMRWLDVPRVATRTNKKIQVA